MDKKVCVIDGPMSAVENLARNEACYEAVKGRVFDEIVRIYSFNQKGVILSKYQHHGDVHEHAWRNQEVTRRKTGGGAVVVDEHTLGYSVFGFLEKVDGSRDNPTHIPYQRMRSAVIGVLNSFGLDAQEEEQWGVRVGAGIVAGHAQRFEKGAYEVHGLLRLKKWDMGEVEKALKLRQKVRHAGSHYLVVSDGACDMERVQSDIDAQEAEVLRSEYAELESAPGLDDAGVSRGVLVERLTAALSSARVSPYPPSLITSAKAHEKSYVNQAYVRAGLEAKRYLGHCFVNLEDK